MGIEGRCGIVETVSSLELDAGAARFRTTSLAASQSYVSATSTGHSLRPKVGPDPVDFVHWNVALDGVDVDLVSVQCGTGFEIDRDGVDRYYVHLPISGRCEIHDDERLFRASAGNVFALNPSSGVMQKRWVGHCRQIMVRIDRQGVERVMADELGIECFEPLVFDPVLLDGASGAVLAQFLISYWHMFMSGIGLNQRLVARSLERSLVSGLLAILPHNYSEELRRPPTTAMAPYYVRRSINFIRANARNSIRPDDLVEAAGVSARSIYYGFRRWHGTTPMAYLRNVRLALARKELVEAARTNGGSVTEIAMNVGYEHLSRFSKDYREKYGESPSVTLRSG